MLGETSHGITGTSLCCDRTTVIKSILGHPLSHQSRTHTHEREGHGRGITSVPLGSSVYCPMVNTIKKCTVLSSVYYTGVPRKMRHLLIQSPLNGHLVSTILTTHVDPLNSKPPLDLSRQPLPWTKTMSMRLPSRLAEKGTQAVAWEAHPAAMLLHRLRVSVKTMTEKTPLRCSEYVMEHMVTQSHFQEGCITLC